MGRPMNLPEAVTSSVDFVVRRDDLRSTAFVAGRDAADAELKPGEVMLRIDRFGLTSNNVGYAALGTTMDYWSFFPTGAGWGRIPAWGFADIVQSRHSELKEGERLYGYLPMSTHLIAPVGSVSAGSFGDASPHRADKAAVYNRYVRLAADPTYDRAHDGSIAIFRPLFTTAFLLDHFLAANVFFGARTVLLSSASSKTALGLAFMLSARSEKPCAVVGLTGRGNVGFVEQTGYYDQVIAYDDLGVHSADARTAFVDFAGNADVVENVHRHHAGKLAYSASVGISHWDKTAPYRDMPGPAPEFFSAPSYGGKRVAEWGMAEFQRRSAGAMQRFLNSTARWFRIVELSGQTALERAYRATLDGKADPAEGYLISLHSNA